MQRRRLLLITFVATFALIAAYTLLSHPRYTSHVKLMAGGSSGSTPSSSDPSSQTTSSALPLLNALLSASGVQTPDTYAELFQERPVAQRVISDLNLPVSTTALLNRVKVRPVANTSLLDLSVTWPDRAMSATIANDYANAFIDRERQLIAGQADQAINVLNHQIPAATQRAAAAQNALTTFQAQHQLADIQTQTQTTINQATDLDTKSAAAQVDGQQARAELASLQGQLGHMSQTTGGPTSVAPNPVYDTLQTQLAQANVQLQVAQQQYTDQHPAVIALKRQVSQLTHQLATTPKTVVSQANTEPNPLYQQLSQQAAAAQARIASDDAQIAQLKVERSRITPQINALPAEAERFLDLQRDSKLAEDVLTALRQKLDNAMISKATALSDISITQPADPRAAEVQPNRLVNLIVGLIASAALAIIVTLLVHAFDRRIRSAQQIEDEVELPVLASVPFVPALRGTLSLTSGRPTTEDAAPPLATANGDDEMWLRAHAVESFLELVTAIRYSSTADRPMRRITITSATQGDGKSTVAINTALTMAHVQPRVLLIDGDLRRPTLHTRMNRELGRGLSDVLVGRVPLDEAIRSTEHEGLDLMTSGTRTPNSVKLLQSKRFDEILDQLLERYETIVIDAPALLPVVDAAILAAKADGTVMVVAIDNSDSAEVRQAITKLQSFGVNSLLGTVANRSHVAKRELYDDYFVLPAPSTTEPVALSS